jgi:hypothetical protein
MKARAAWICCCVVLFACPVFAQDLQVLPDPFEGGPPKEMTTRYLRNLARQAVEKRRVTFEGLKDRSDILAYQQRLREQFIEKLGAFPEKTPLNARVVGTIQGNGYRIENVVFESRPRHYVVGNLYLPEGKGPHPGAIHSCGHSNLTGKASGEYQRAGILAAKHGIAVFCYDPIGQGERFQMLNADGSPRYRLSTTEHSHVGTSCILVGKNAATYRIWDGMRALDYLESRPDILKGKYGCTGISGGGTLTEYLMALDDRIYCAAPGCAPSHFARRIDTSGMGDAEQNIFGQIAWGLDHPDYTILRAPKPTLILAATHDFVDISGTWDLFREGSRVYAKLGHPERMALVEADAKHGYSKGLREGMTAWMRRWLLGVDGNVIESDLKTHPAAELRCSPNGQVQLIPGARTVMDLNGDLLEQRAPARRELWRPENRAKAINEVRRIAGIRPLESLPRPSDRRVGKIERPGYTIEKMVLDTEPGIWLPALYFQPARASAPRVLYVHGGGKAIDAAPGGPIEMLVLAGHPVLAPDIRSCGEIGPAPSKEWGGSFYEIFMAYKLGKSFVGMRAEDILVCARFLSETGTKAPAPVHLVAVAEAGPAALHAATMEKPLFAHVTLRDSMTSWIPTVRDPTLPGQLVQAVHGALEAYDLRDLLRSLPTDSLTVEAGSP